MTSWTMESVSPRLLPVLTAFAFSLLVLCVFWGAFDRRLLDGALVWVKPAKFALSFTILFATIDVVERRLSAAWRNGMALHGVVMVMGISMMLEMSYIIVQAASGEQSHFNLSTPFNAFIYTVVMAGGAVLLILGTGIFGVVALRDRQADLGVATRRGIGLGFLISFVLTLIVAGYMSSSPGHFVGVPSDPAAVLPFLGWSRQVGDLRPSHFLALHAMQFMPLVGVALDRNPLMPSAAGRLRFMTIVAIAYTGLIMTLFAQAIMGMPLIPM